MKESEFVLPSFQFGWLGEFYYKIEQLNKTDRYQYVHKALHNSKMFVFNAHRCVRFFSGFQ